jgi:aldehyde dehydrogenase
MFALNQGEVCTCPSRALIQESIYDKFMERALKRVAAIKQANPLDPTTMIGAQVSNEQLEKILSYIDIGQQGRRRGADRRQTCAPGRRTRGRLLRQPTVFRGHNRMRIFQEEIFGPVVSVTTFKNEEDALAIANDTLYGLGAGFGAATPTAAIAWAAASRQAASGSTATTRIRRTRPLADTSNRALAAKPTA